MKKRHIALAYLGLFSFGMIDNARGPLYPEILNSWQLSTSLGSYIFSLASIASLLANLLSRFWLPRWETINALKIALLLQFISCLGMGLAGEMTNGFTLLLVFSFVFGFSSGLVGIAANIAVGKTEARLRLRFLSGLHSMYGLASLLIPFAISILIKFINWPAIFKVMALIPLLFFLISLTIKNIPINLEKKILPPIPFPFRLHIGLIFSFYVASEVAISSQLVLYLNRGLHFPLPLAQNYLSIFFALLLTGRLLFSSISLPISGQKLMYLSLTCSLIAALIGFFAHPLGLVACGLTMSCFFPCAMDWLNDHYPNWASQLTASVMTSVGIMLIIMHILVGQLADIYNIQKALMLTVPAFIVISWLMLYACKARS